VIGGLGWKGRRLRAVLQEDKHEQVCRGEGVKRSRRTAGQRRDF
jgi:hypothetical protein